MSTPGTGGTSEGPPDDVNHFAETQHRDLPNQRREISSTSPYETGHTASYPAEPYPSAPYSSGPYPSGPFAAGPYPAQQPQYGYGPPPRQGSTARNVLIVLTLLCVVALAVVCVVVWMKVADSDDDSSAGAPRTQVVTSTPSSSVYVDPEVQAGSDLAAASQADSADVRSNYDNRWAAQVSAKQLGLVAEGRTWNNAAIYGEYTSLKQRYPNVKLLNSSEWPVFSQSNWWIIISAQSFDGPDAALSWCVSQSLDKDHCFAKFISTTSGPTGSTRYQR